MKLSGDVVNEVERFKCLGSVLQKNVGLMEDMKHRIKKKKEVKRKKKEMERSVRNFVEQENLNQVEK